MKLAIHMPKASFQVQDHWLKHALVCIGLLSVGSTHCRTLSQALHLRSCTDLDTSSFEAQPEMTVHVANRTRETVGQLDRDLEYCRP